MDLYAEAQRLALDALAIRISDVFTKVGVGHALLKGPSTTSWLYDSPRLYNDVDFLVAASCADQAANALLGAGVASGKAGRIGEEAPHSLLLFSADGYEIDLHLSLPTMPISGDRVWLVLREHIEPLDLKIGTLPALDEPGRCLTLALHALNSGRSGVQAIEDLRRARQRASASAWATAGSLAANLDSFDLYQAGLSMVDGVPTPTSARARLYLLDGPSASFGIERILRARLRDLPTMIWQELFPTSEFMAYAERELGHPPRGGLISRIARWGRIVRQLPTAIRAVIRAHRSN